jgi:hypothetical protein
MASKIDLDSTGIFGMVLSDRLYENLGVTYKFNSRGVVVTATKAYLDPLTGLMVADIEAYEEWITGVTK